MLIVVAAFAVFAAKQSEVGARWALIAAGGIAVTLAGAGIQVLTNEPIIRFPWLGAFAAGAIQAYLVALAIRRWGRRSNARA
jgi:hypothetical protein